MKKYIKIGIISGILIAVVGITIFALTSKNQTTGIANPASVYCINHGGSEVTVTDQTGAQQGICKFPNGSTCDEWQYFRGECKPTP